MAHILVVGGGLSGCAAALELADRGQDVTILEKDGRIGGKVRDFGCKASEKCNHCGVCLAAGLWEKALRHDRIRVLTRARLIDVSGGPGDFTAVYDHPAGRAALSGISAVVVAIGYEAAAQKSPGSLERSGGNVITGLELEKLLAGRCGAGALPAGCASVAFLQCIGSRDVKEKALYCSRVCCGYATRAAKALKFYDPKLSIVIFYMDLQAVEPGYYEGLERQGVEFVRCRPIRIRPGERAAVVYEHPETGALTAREFDLIVLSEGIHPAADAEQVAEFLPLGLDERGFLRSLRPEALTKVYLAGCAGGPKRIEEAYGDAVATAARVAEDLGRSAPAGREGSA